MMELLRAVPWLVGIVMGTRFIFAYIDPNTGGMIFQLLAILMASLTGIMLFFSRQIRITAARIRRRFGDSSSNSSVQSSGESLPGSSSTTQDSDPNT